MTTVNNTLSWIVALAIVIAILALALGLALSHTDLLNFNTSAAEANAMNAKTQAETEKAQADLAAYRAQKEAEIASAEAEVQTQRQAAALQAVKSVIDQQFYLIGKANEALKQQADIEVSKAQQLAQADVARARQLAEIKAWEDAQAQSRAQELARAVQEMENARLTRYGLLAGGGVIVLALAVGIVIAASKSAKGQTVAKQVEPIQAEQAVGAAAAPQAKEEQALARAYWLERRRQARANEIALNMMKIAEQVARGPTSIEAEHQGNGKHPTRPRRSSAYARHGQLGE